MISNDTLDLALRHRNDLEAAAEAERKRSASKTRRHMAASLRGLANRLDPEPAPPPLRAAPTCRH